MEREQTTKEEVHTFIKLLKNLNAEQQAGLLLVTEGMHIIADKRKKRRMNHR